MKLFVKLTVFSVAAVSAGLISALHADSPPRCDDQEVSFEAWTDWPQVTQQPVMSAGHSNNWVGIFANPLAQQIYLDQGTSYPVCAAIVKPAYTDAEGQTIKQLTMMMKMPEGFDPENGDWWYAISGPSGTNPVPQLRRSVCISCHEQAAETDYLFSGDVMEALSE